MQTTRHGAADPPRLIPFSIQIWLIDTFQRSTVALIMFSVGCGRHAFYRARLQWMQCRSDDRGAFD